METQRDAVHTTPDADRQEDRQRDQQADRQDEGRGASWHREDLSEEPASHGTREDVGQSGGMREDTAATPGFVQERGPAASLSDAAAETGVSEQSAETPRGQSRSLDDFGRDGNDRLEIGGHNSGARNPSTRREDPANTLDALNNATEGAPQKPE